MSKTSDEEADATGATPPGSTDVGELPSSLAEGARRSSRSTNSRVRDEFSAATRNALAMRAGFLCSFEECGRLTVGPSDQGSSAHAVLGVAAHISAAAPGGARYRPELSSDERKNIRNGIWLCPDHSILIDREERTYTEAVLHEMRDRHERNVARQLKERRAPALSTSPDLVALGPGIIFAGEVVEMSEPDWTVRVSNFVRGDRGELAAFCSQFFELCPGDRYILSNELGDGRVLIAPPRWSAVNGLLLQCRTAPRYPRSRAQDLGADLRLDETGDVDFSGQLISGVDALPQKIKLCLSMRKGEWYLERGFGTRIAEYVELFDGSPTLDRLASLEVIRMASIPLEEKRTGRHHTQLECVERVIGFRFLSSPEIGKDVRVELECVVNGVGPWRSCMNIHLSSDRVPEPFDVAALVQELATKGNLR